MAYGIVHFFAGGTKEQYDASLAAVHPGGVGLPKGQTFHAAGPSAGGWTVMAVHDSKESWERFRDDTLMPKPQAGREGRLHRATTGAGVRDLQSPPVAASRE